MLGSIIDNVIILFSLIISELTQSTLLQIPMQFANSSFDVVNKA